MICDIMYTLFERGVLKMAKKMYFQLRPENFKMYDRISRDGDIKLRRAESFDVEDPYYKLKVIPKEDKTFIVKVYSNKLELRTYGEILLTDAVLSAQKAAGFYYSFRPELTEDEKENERLIQESRGRKEEYVSNVIEFFADAKTAAKNYRNDISFQDKQVQRSLKQISRRLR